MTKIFKQLSRSGLGGSASAPLKESQKKQNRLRRVMSMPDMDASTGPPIAGERPPSEAAPPKGNSSGGTGKSRRRRHTVQSGAALPTLAPPATVPGIMKVLTLDDSLHSRYSSSSTGATGRTSTTSVSSNNSVEFQHVEIREYKRAMGDNPSVMAGPPIGIGWEVEERMVVPIDDYETYKQKCGKHQSDQLSFILPRAERERLLMENGYTRRDIADAVREVVRSKSRRRTTVVNLGRTTVAEEAVQSVMRKFKRGVLGVDRDIEYSAHHEKWAAEAERAAQIILEENLAAAAEEACIDIDDIDPSEFFDAAPDAGSDDIRTNLKTSGRSRAAAEALVEAQEENLRASRTSSITAVEEDEFALPAVPSESAPAGQPTNKPPPIKIFVANGVDGGEMDGDAPSVPPPPQVERVHGEDFAAPPTVAPEKEGVHGEDFATKPPVTATPPPTTAKLFGKGLPAAKDLVKIPAAPATKLFQEVGRAA